ncbi:hypothetical protein TNIN_442971 [Trichonephila inaurata madagascariensis]|uniref:Uncharacterized protein n=1 Tax=Trichonephila inaurata madagascariensis TaxID=2747483 RepID=A0A8X6X9E5_9ARAC|nr:hypothetical protein TNIN_442971 [Trichonephila inaurata madagascariensis]
MEIAVCMLNEEWVGNISEPGTTNNYRCCKNNQHRLPAGSYKEHTYPYDHPGKSCLALEENHQNSGLPAPIAGGLNFEADLFLPPCNPNTNKAVSTIDYCFNLLNWLSGNGKEVVLQWIPVHFVVLCNETTDYLAKKRSVSPPNITFRSFIRLHQVNC